MKTLGSKQIDVKNANHKLIVSTLRQKGALSITAIAKLLSLSNPSVTKNIEELISREILIETGTIATKAGRRPIQIQINETYGYVAAVDLTSTKTKIAISNMNSSIVAYEEIENLNKISKSYLENLVDILNRMVENLNIKNRLLVICIGTPGDIDPKTNYFINAPRFEDCTNINIYGIFSARFKIPILVKNDVNLATLGEYKFGAGKDLPNMFYITVDYGIGSGMIFDHKLYEGNNGYAGEIGLWIVDISNAVDQLQKGSIKTSSMLDSHISGFAIIVLVREAIKKGEPSIITNWAKRLEDINMDNLAEAYKFNDKLCKSIIDNSAIRLALALKNVADLLDIKTIVIGGASKKFGDNYLDTVKFFLEKSRPVHNPDIVWSKLGDDATLFGAISRGIDTVYEYALEKKEFSQKDMNLQV